MSLSPFRCIPGPRRHAIGFTLIELMVTLTILAILLALAIPSFARLLAANRVSTETSELIASLNLARSEAVRRGQAVTLRALDSSNYSKGWRVFADLDQDGAQSSATNETDGKPLREVGSFSGTTTIRRVSRSAPPGAFTYSDVAASDSARSYLVFTARGAVAANAQAFFRICDSAYPSLQGRIVQINAVGKVTLDGVDATCS